MGPTKYIPQSARLIQNLSLKTVIGEMKNKSPQMSVVIPVEYFLIKSVKRVSQHRGYGSQTGSSGTSYREEPSFMGFVVNLCCIYL